MRLREVLPSECGNLQSESGVVVGRGGGGGHYLAGTEFRLGRVKSSVGGWW